MQTLPFLLAVFFNVACSTGISLCNKATLHRLGSDFSPLLTVLHFVFTSVYAAATIGWDFAFVRRLVNGSIKWKVAGTIVMNCLSVLSLMYSVSQKSLGFYQMSKLASIPTTLVFQFLLFRETPTILILLCLTLLVSGIALATATDSQAATLNVWVASIAVVSTSLTQIFSSKVQKEINPPLASFEWVSVVFGMSFVFIAIALGVAYAISPNALSETTRSADVELNVSEGLVFALLSACLAVGINWSTTFVLSESSPITYLVIGQFKTGLLLLSSFLFFGQEFSPLNLAGIAMAVAGATSYGLAKIQNKVPEEKKQQ